MKPRTGCLSIWVLVLAIYFVVWMFFEFNQLKRASNLYRRGEYARAAEMFGRVIRKSPDQADAWVGRAMSRLQLGDLRGARSDADSALAADPARPVFGLLARGTIRLAGGDTEGGMDDCTRGIAVLPIWGPLHGCRAAAHLQAGRLDSALVASDSAIHYRTKLLMETWDKLLYLRSSQDLYIQRCGLRRLAGELDSALADCESALKLGGGPPGGFLNKGLVLAAKGDSAGAEEAFAWFRKRRPRETGYLDAELRWAREGMAPTPERVFQARQLARGSERPLPADSVRAQEPPTPAVVDRATGSDPAVQARDRNPEPAGENETFLKRQAPLAFSWIGGAFLMLLTLVAQAIAASLKTAARRAGSVEQRLAATRLRPSLLVRIFMMALVGSTLLVSAWHHRPVTFFLAILIGLFGLDSWYRVGKAAQLAIELRE